LPGHSGNRQRRDESDEGRADLLLRPRLQIDEDADRQGAQGKRNDVSVGPAIAPQIGNESRAVNGGGLHIDELERRFGQFAKRPLMVIAEWNRMQFNRRKDPGRASRST
jgi:hypothetical protein